MYALPPSSPYIYPSPSPSPSPYLYPTTGMQSETQPHESETQLQESETQPHKHWRILHNCRINCYIDHDLAKNIYPQLHTKNYHYDTHV